MKKLQCILIRFLNCGVITAPPVNDPKQRIHQVRYQTGTGFKDFAAFRRALPNEDPVASSAMPESWVRAILLVRSNYLSGESSGVRPELVTSLAHLIHKSVTPIIPLRGSLSASGDSIPLSYMPAMLHGSSEVKVWTDGERGDLGRQRVVADVALSGSSLAPLQLGPKDGLAMVNGTAVSAGVSSLALNDAHDSIIPSQVLTAMGVEALRGSTESFDPFFSEIRPHCGQREVSRNIRNFSRDLTLVSGKVEDYAKG